MDRLRLPSETDGLKQHEDRICGAALERKPHLGKVIWELLWYGYWDPAAPSLDVPEEDSQSS